jgi:hypothetical protein
LSGLRGAFVLAGLQANDGFSCLQLLLRKLPLALLWRPGSQVRSRPLSVSVCLHRRITQQMLLAYHRHNKTNSVAFRPQAKYTDWSTTAFRRNLVPTFVDRGVSRGQRGGSPTAVNLSFLDRSSYFFFQVALHLSSQGQEWAPFQAHCYSENLVAPGMSVKHGLWQ